ncbi:MAG: mechanosensitive ion channel [Saprospiraceae bacterium]|nr:mechanosensitive ion channel [Lewinella sp.]
MAKKNKWIRITIEAVLLLILTATKFLPDDFPRFPVLQEDHVITLISFGILLLATRLILKFTGWWYRKQAHMTPDQDDNVIYGLSNLYYLLIVTFGVLTALRLFGIDYRDLFTSLSIVAAAIAIISKDFITEIISGFIISFSRQINANDYVKIGENKGKIIDINLTKTTLINEDDDIIIIPNNRVFSSEIINYTRREIKKISTEFEIDLKVLDSVEQLENELIETLKEYRKFIQKNSYNLKIVQIKKDHLQMKFQYILHQVDRDLERTIRRKVARQVVRFARHQQSTTESPDPVAE